MEKHQELETIRIAFCSEDKDENSELMEILSISGNKLRELVLGTTGITGLGFKEAGISLPNLETLDLSCCVQITDRGLKEILSISGNKLRVLNLSETEITGIGFKEAGISLPNLETLNLEHVYISESKLLEILHVLGNGLMTLHATDISTATEATIKQLFPSLLVVLLY